MTYYPKTSGINLSIFGSSGNNSIFSTESLYLKSDYNSEAAPLYLKSSSTGMMLPAITNWDVSLASASRINSLANGDIEYSLSDFSSNRFDSYYSSNQGAESLNYTLSHEWSVNDLALNEDLLVVATKNYTSFEKYTTQSDAKIVACYFDFLDYNFPGSGTSTSYTLYEIRVDWIAAGVCLTGGGTLTVSYQYGEETLSHSVTLPNSTTSPNSDFFIIYATSETVSWTYSEGADWPQDGMECLEFQTLSTSSITITTPDPTPPSWISRNGAYIDPSDLNPKLTHFLIPDFVEMFEDQDKTWFKFAGSTTLIGSEVPDYSDIYLKIAYDSTSGVDSGYIYGVDTANTERLYKFGGFKKFEEFYSQLIDSSTVGEKTSISEDQDFFWYIILKDGKDAGRYYSVALSNYVTWDYIYDGNIGADEFNKLVYYKSSTEVVPLGSLPNTNYAHYEPLDLRFISVKHLSVVKVAGFPNCGKVDLYFPKVGSVHGIQSGSNVILSSGHGLSSGDRIKFTEVLGSGNTLRGLKYVTPIDEDNFQIYYDKDGINPASVYNVSTPTGIRWSAIDGNTWKYATTLYSPVGKNGYGGLISLNSSIEIPSTGETPIELAVESAAEKAQSDLTGQRSWNNYYPYERFNSNDSLAFDVVNGNKFGSAVSIKKYGDDYILLVAEEGASESFDIINDFEISEEDFLPNNRRVVPDFFPCGRIHFYKITTSTESIEYITSYSSPNNPWSLYENINLQERLLETIKKWDNSSISSSDINSYNSSANDYWKGSRFLQWVGSYFYDDSVGISLPNQNEKINHYGFVDSLKSADFEIEGNNVYCVFSINSKAADFNTGDRIGSLDSIIKTVSFNVLSPSSKTTSQISVSNSTYETSDVIEQKSEYTRFGRSLKMFGNKLVFGWPSSYKNEEYIYYYRRSGDSYEERDILVSDGANSFGARIVVDQNFIISDSPIAKEIDVYRYDSRIDKYYRASSLSTSSEKYSYDFTQDVLVKREDSKYVGYQWNYSSNGFVEKFNKDTIGSSVDSILRISKGRQAAFFDSSEDYDTGSYNKSLQIIDASTTEELSLNNYIFSLDTHYPEYLPLTIKTIEGSGQSNINMVSLAHDHINSGVPIAIQPPMPYSGGVNLFAKQTDLCSSGISLFHKSTSLSSGYQPLIIHQQQYSGYLPLFIGSIMNSGMTLYTDSRIDSSLKEAETSLYINSFRTFSPCYYWDNDLDGNLDTVSVDGNTYSVCGYDGNIDGGNSGFPSLKFPLFMKSQQSDVISGSISLYISSPGTGLASDINLWNAGEDGSGNVFNGLSLRMYGSGYNLNNGSGSMNLWIRSPATEQLGLFVYNTVITGYIPAFISGVNWIGSGLSIGISGTHTPNETLRLYTRGDL